MPAFKLNYINTGRVRLAFRNLPLEAIHVSALGAAIAAACAGRQGKFWEFHNVLYREQAQLDDTSLRKSAQDLGIDMSHYDGCVHDPDVRDLIRRDRSVAMALRVAATPTLMIGNADRDGRVRIQRVLSGIQSIDGLQEAVDAVSREVVQGP